MNFFGLTSYFPGLGVDGENVPPTPGVCALRLNNATGKLQLSNNGGAFLDVASGNSGKSLIAGNNINVTTDVSDNWIVSTKNDVTLGTITASSLTTSGSINAVSLFCDGALTAQSSLTTSGALTSNSVVTSALTVNGAATVTGTLSTSSLTTSSGINTQSITVSGSIAATTLNLSNPSNTADIFFTTLSTSGSGDPNFVIRTQRGSISNGENSIVGRLGLYYNTQLSSGINFHRGGGTSDGYMSFYTGNTTRLTLDRSGLFAYNLTGTDHFQLLDANLTSGQRKIHIGRSLTNDNAAVVKYVSSAVGASTNYLGLGIVGSEETLVVAGNDRVGINTNSPAYDLDVASVIRARGQLITPSISVTGNGFVEGLRAPSSAANMAGAISFNNGSLRCSNGNTYITLFNAGGTVQFTAFGATMTAASLNDQVLEAVLATVGSARKLRIFTILDYRLDSCIAIVTSSGMSDLHCNIERVATAIFDIYPIIGATRPPDDWAGVNAAVGIRFLFTG